MAALVVRRASVAASSCSTIFVRSLPASTLSWTAARDRKCRRPIRDVDHGNRTLATDEASEAVVDSPEIEAKRNKSGLKPWMRRRMVMTTDVDSSPPTPLFDYETTVKARRRLYAKYGRASGIDPAISWPSADELQRAVNMELELEPDLRLMLDELERRKRVEEIRFKDREAKVEAQMAKLDGWMRDLQARKDKKVAEAQALREKKERVIEEVRQYFGYKLSPKDPKFQEVVELKEKEDKKMEKEVRKKEKMAREMARLAALAQQQQQTAADDAGRKSKDPGATGD